MRRAILLLALFSSFFIGILSLLLFRSGGEFREEHINVVGGNSKGCNISSLVTQRTVVVSGVVGDGITWGDITMTRVARSMLFSSWNYSTFGTGKLIDLLLFAPNVEIQEIPQPCFRIFSSQQQACHQYSKVIQAHGQSNSVCIVISFANHVPQLSRFSLRPKDVNYHTLAPFQDAFYQAIIHSYKWVLRTNAASMITPNFPQGILSAHKEELKKKKKGTSYVVLQGRNEPHLTLFGKGVAVCSAARALLGEKIQPGIEKIFSSTLDGTCSSSFSVGESLSHLRCEDHGPVSFESVKKRQHSRRMILSGILADSTVVEALAQRKWDAATKITVRSYSAFILYFADFGDVPVSFKANFSAPQTTCSAPKTPPKASDSIMVTSYIPKSVHNNFVGEMKRMILPSWHYTTRAPKHRYAKPQDTSTKPWTRVDLILMVELSLISSALAAAPFCYAAAPNQTFGGEIGKRVFLFHNPSELARLPQKIVQMDPSSKNGVCLLVVHTFPSHTFWERKNNKFMFSVEYLVSGPYQELLSQYERVLRTDGDIFLTPSFRYWRPSKVLVTGGGGYATFSHTGIRLGEVAATLGLRHQGKHNIGSTWFGEPEIVLKALNLTLEVAKYLLNNEFDGPEKLRWPYWWAGVVSMYASELSVNHLVDACAMEKDQKRLDAHSTSTESASMVVHIHCWHTHNDFSKFSFHEGKYRKEAYPLSRLDRNTNRGYAFWMALHYDYSSSET